MPNRFLPEGMTIDQPENRAAMESVSALRDAMESGRILEGRAVVCDSKHNLIVDLGCMKGVIPRTQAAVGIEEGVIRDIAIISRVGKPVCFVVTDLRLREDGKAAAILSRRQVQERCQRDYLDRLVPGDVIRAKVTHLEPFGCFVDIGCGITSLIPIDAISISRIAHPKDRFYPGQEILVAIKTVDSQSKRITLTHKELLGAWEENAAEFTPGETVTGVIRSVEQYGIFVELTPNLAGLAEPREGVSPGQRASVYIKSLIPEKMKVKLIIVDAFEEERPLPVPVYYCREKHIDRWRYSPDCSDRVIETVFGAE